MLHYYSHKDFIKSKIFILIFLFVRFIGIIDNIFAFPLNALQVIIDFFRLKKFDMNSEASLFLISAFMIIVSYPNADISASFTEALINTFPVLLITIKFVFSIEIGSIHLFLTFSIISKYVLSIPKFFKLIFLLKISMGNFIISSCFLIFILYLIIY